jgi:DNA replication factor GINS
MAETTLENLKRHLDSEIQAKDLLPLPADFYSRISSYSQSLKRSAGSGNSEVLIRLASVQAKMLESMVSQLLTLRLKKATRQDTPSRLLPEERYVSSAEQKFQRRFRTMVEAVSQGKPSFVEFAHKAESRRNVSVKFVKHVNELVGFDMRRYGPFEANDVASIPAASADILIAGGDAVEIVTREDV